MWAEELEDKQACLIRRKRDKKDHAPGHLTWPVLKRPRMAGFALTTEDASGFDTLLNYLKRR
jgi:hypothetical protein